MWACPAQISNDYGKNTTRFLLRNSYILHNDSKIMKQMYLCMPFQLVKRSRAETGILDIIIFSPLPFQHTHAHQHLCMQSLSNWY